ncbi:MAG: ABC transporter substrate-binding protein [Burkholderiales bacterium]
MAVWPGDRSGLCRWMTNSSRTRRWPTTRRCSRSTRCSAAYFVRASYGREAERLVELLGVIGMSRVAVAHLDNPGGKEVLASVRAAMQAKSAGADVVAFAAVKNDGSNAAEAGKTLAAAKPQAVIMFLAGPPTVELIKTMTADGSAPSFYGLSSVAKALGDKMPSLSVAQVVHYPWGEADSVAHSFRDQCAAAKAVVSYAAFEGWVNAHAMMEGLRRSGANPTRESLHAAMRSMKARVAGLELDYTGNSSTGSRFVELVHVRPNGTYLR